MRTSLSEESIVDQIIGLVKANAILDNSKLLADLGPSLQQVINALISEPSVDKINSYAKILGLIYSSAESDATKLIAISIVLAQLVKKTEGSIDLLEEIMKIADVDSDLRQLIITLSTTLEVELKDIATQVKARLPDITVTDFPEIIVQLQLRHSIFVKDLNNFEELYKSLNKTTFEELDPENSKANIEKFLQTVKLKDIHITYNTTNFKDRDSSGGIAHDFGIRLTGRDENGQERVIYLSNRNPTKGELRQNNFLEAFKKWQQDYPELTLAEFFIQYGADYDVRSHAFVALCNSTSQLNTVISEYDDNIVVMVAKKIIKDETFTSEFIRRLSEFLKSKEFQPRPEEYKTFCHVTFANQLISYLAEQKRADLIPEALKIFTDAEGNFFDKVDWVELIKAKFWDSSDPSYYESRLHLIRFITEDPTQNLTQINPMIQSLINHVAIMTDESFPMKREIIQQIMRIYYMLVNDLKKRHEEVDDEVAAENTRRSHTMQSMILNTLRTPSEQLTLEKLIKLHEDLEDHLKDARQENSLPTRAINALLRSEQTGSRLVVNTQMMINKLKVLLNQSQEGPKMEAAKRTWFRPGPGPSLFQTKAPNPPSNNNDKQTKSFQK